VAIFDLRVSTRGTCYLPNRGDMLPSRRLCTTSSGF
jgi:hypothetical protein